MSSGRINRNRNPRIFLDARDSIPGIETYTQLLRIERDSKNEKLAARADRLLKMAELVLAGLVKWQAPGFQDGDLGIDDMHSSFYFARMTHEEVDRVIKSDSTELLTMYPEDVALEVGLYRTADREIKKLGEGESLSKERFLWVIGKG